jgi:hypothetical protein
VRWDDWMKRRSPVIGDPQNLIGEVRSMRKHVSSIRLATAEQRGHPIRSGLRTQVVLIVLAFVITLPIAHAANASGPTIASVGFGGNAASPVVTISGSSFGSTVASLGSPQAAGGCGGSGSDYGNNLSLSDTAAGWTGGQGPGDCIGLLISSYSDTKIVFTLGSSYASLGDNLTEGDTFSLTVLGATFSGTVVYSGGPLRIITQSLRGATLKAPYKATLVAAGGNPPYAWKLVPGSGRLPKGLHLNRSTGVLSGRPGQHDSGTSLFTVEVLDKKTKTVTHSVTPPVTQTLGITMLTSITPRAPITYTTLTGSGAGQQESLTPWVGRNVAVLTPAGDSFDSAIMSQIVGELDATWDYYASITGRDPTPWASTQYQGRDTIAVVPTDCGAACSYLGTTGTEIQPAYFQTLYDGVQNSNQYDQVMFYEFGRNFWFYGSQLSPSTTYGSTVTTGFADLMRFQSMNAIRVQGGPFNGTPFATFEAQEWGIASDYDSDLTKTFANTLAVGASPSVYGGTDFFSAIVHLLATHYGGDCFERHLWTAVLSEPSVTTDDAAVTNFISAASQVAGVDLGPFFYDYWSFPQPDGTTNPRVAGGIDALPLPSPSAVCSS